MSAVSDAQRAFYLTTGLAPTARLDDAISNAVLAGTKHEAAHLKKHLDAYVLEATGNAKTVATEWQSRINADTTQRITRVLDG